MENKKLRSEDVRKVSGGVQEVRKLQEDETQTKLSQQERLERLNKIKKQFTDN